MTGEYAINVKIVNNTLIDKFVKLWNNSLKVS
jgi:hypothetical protein